MGVYASSGPYILPPPIDKPKPEASDANGLGKIVNGVPYCADCGSRMYLREGVDYGRNFFGCSNFPKCRGTLGCPLDGSPRGIPGNEEVRRARVTTHRFFDYFWKTRVLTRETSYLWLAVELGITVEEAHISNFGLKECQKTIEACKALFDLVEIKKIQSYVKRKLRNK
jgi:ssDNA-binding Zn-finger/Zn-ribbon topoisomerase 1